MTIDIPAFIEWVKGDVNAMYILTALVGAILAEVIKLPFKLFKKKGQNAAKCIKETVELVKKVTEDGKVDANDLNYLEEYLNKVK